MEKRTLGASQLRVNPVGLGCMGFSHASGDPTEKSAAVKTLREGNYSEPPLFKDEIRMT